MAFGQSSGPPATGRQVQQLTALLHAAGHADFRDARGPLGLTQRQAAGKFTRDEADALITQLEENAEGDGEGEAHGHPDPHPPGAPVGGVTGTPSPAGAPVAGVTGTPSRAGAPVAGVTGTPSTAAAPGARRAATPSPTADRRGAERARQLREMPTDLLAAELQRRGWIVMEP